MKFLSVCHVLKDSTGDPNAARQAIPPPALPCTQCGAFPARLGWYARQTLGPTGFPVIIPAQDFTGVPFYYNILVN